MANYFVSLTNKENDYVGNPSMNSGGSSTASDKIELRMDTTISRYQAIKACEKFIKWIKEGGLIGDGANVPLT